jgi:glutamate carboxypeptidase
LNAPILRFLEERSAEMLELLRRLVEADSPSTDKASVDSAGALLASALEQAGARVDRIPVAEYGDHLRAELAIGESGRDPVLVLGHLDTVWECGTLREMPFRVEEGRAFGPGVFDMKGGLVQLVFAFRALHELGIRGVRAVAFINSDEEVGSLSSRQLIEDEARRSRAVFVLEPSLPPDGKLKTFRKGVGIFQLSIKGKAAHAGLDPGKGVSAIEELARQILALHQLSDPERGVTVNVGVARGGTRVNVVPAEASAEIDLRVSSLESAARLEERILGLKPFLAGAEVRVSGGIDRPPLERTEAVVRLFEQARRLAEELGFPLGEGPAGGGSDGNLTAALGIPTLDGMGAVGDGAHAPNEHLLIAELPRRAALLARLIETT